MNISIGKIRRLQQLTRNGYFKVIAIDHRDVFVNMLKSANKPHAVDDIVKEKLKIIELSGSDITGYLIDPHFALPECIYKNVLPENLGFMVNFEDNDYDVKNFDDNYFIKGFSVEKIAALGASALKLFMYYNPTGEYVEKQEAIIEKLCMSCDKYSLPFLLEPVLYYDKDVTYQEKIQTAYDMIKRLSKYKVDIFKIDFPGDVDILSKEENLKICQDISAILDVPWVIMSSGISMDIFEKQLEIACRGGACGYVVGRALWSEYVLKDGKREEEIKLMKSGIKTLGEIVDKNAKPIKEKLGYANSKYDQHEWYTRLKI
ncbi:MAG: hypothetical protein R3Y36_00765 [Spirochaetales bacterium]